jgi:hypothetical protein
MTAPLWWLAYRRRGAVAGVVIAEGQALVAARMNASLKGLEDGVVFAGGHVLDAAMAAQVPKGKIGRMLPPAEAAALLDRLDGRRR